MARRECVEEAVLVVAVVLGVADGAAVAAEAELVAGAVVARGVGAPHVHRRAGAEARGHHGVHRGARLGRAVAAAVAEAARLRPVVLGAVHEAHARIEAAPGRCAAVALRAHVPLRGGGCQAQKATENDRETFVPCPPCAWRSRRASSCAASQSSRSACPSRCEPGRQPASEASRRRRRSVRRGRSTAHGLFMPRMTWLT